MDGRCAATRSVAQQASIDWRLLYLADHVGTMQSRDPFTPLFVFFFPNPTKEKGERTFPVFRSPVTMSDVSALVHHVTDVSSFRP